MPKFKIIEGKYVTGKGKDRKTFTRGDAINLTMDQAKKHGLASLELVDAKDTPKGTTNPGQAAASKAAKEKATAKKAAEEKAAEEAANKDNK